VRLPATVPSNVPSKLACEDCPHWRDFPPEYQLQLRNLMGLLAAHPGLRYEVRLLRGGEMQVAEVSRRAVIGRGQDLG
jgi:hypothetical protein